MKNAPRFQLRSYSLITILCCLLLTGCSLVREHSPFFKIPREQVVELSTQKVDWLRDLPNPHGELSDETLALEDAVDDHLERYGSHVPPGKEYTCI
mgnify:CR=1 FL=1